MYSMIELFTMSYIVGGWSEAIVIHTDFCYAISRNFMAFQSRALYCLFGILRNFSHLGADFTTFFYFPFYFVLYIFVSSLFASFSYAIFHHNHLSKQWSFLYTYLILFASLLCNFYIFLFYFSYFKKEKEQIFAFFIADWQNNRMDELEIHSTEIFR